MHEDQVSQRCTLPTSVRNIVSEAQYTILRQRKVQKYVITPNFQWYFPLCSPSPSLFTVMHRLHPLISSSTLFSSHHLPSVPLAPSPSCTLLTLGGAADVKPGLYSTL